MNFNSRDKRNRVMSELVSFLSTLGMTNPHLKIKFLKMSLEDYLLLGGKVDWNNNPVHTHCYSYPIKIVDENVWCPLEQE